MNLRVFNMYIKYILKRGARLGGAVVCFCAFLSACDGRGLEPLEKGVSIESPKTAMLVIQDYCPQEGHRFGDLWVIARSYLIESGQILRDWDRDGIPDIRDNDPELGLSAVSMDSNQDGYRDILIYRAGLTTESQRNLRLCTDPDIDSDGDGFNDCEEENLLHTSSTKWDSDLDGVPDALEVRVGMNPMDGTDAQQSPSGEAFTNALKVKLNLPIYESLSTITADVAIKYQTSVLLEECLEFTVDNIAVMEASNGDLVELYVVEMRDDGKRSLRIIPILLDKTQPHESTPAKMVQEWVYSEGSAAEWYVQ